jgi:hypothetical protein
MSSEIGKFAQKLIDNNMISEIFFKNLSIDEKTDLDTQAITDLIFANIISVNQFLSLSLDDKADLQINAKIIKDNNIDINEFLSQRGPDRFDFLSQYKFKNSKV